MNVQSKRVRVSIFCTAYNQCDYIAQAIDSFLSQKTDFGFEILVNDDASDDGTTEILLEYERLYPDLVHVVAHEENQYSKGFKGIAQNNLYPIAQGDYIALCEGDDFWCDDDKLQMQFDIMESHPSCSLCVHASDNVFANSGKPISKNAPFQQDCFVDEEYMLENAHPFATNSYFIRRSAYERYGTSGLMDLKAHGDQKMSSYFGLIGDVYYLARTMSCYRVLAKNSINARLQESDDYASKQRELLKNRLELLEYIGRLTDGKYENALIRAKDRMHQYYYEAISDFISLKRDYPEYWADLSISSRFKMRLKGQFPSVYRTMKKQAVAILDR